MKIWVLRIEHKHGVNVSAHGTKEHAMEEVAEYAAYWWVDAQLFGAPGKAPDDPAERVRAYFTHVEIESYEIHECEMESGPMDEALHKAADYLSHDAAAHVAAHGKWTCDAGKLLTVLEKAGLHLAGDDLTTAPVFDAKAAEIASRELDE